MSKFKLSDKKFWDGVYCYEENDVKIFIKKLKLDIKELEDDLERRYTFEDTLINPTEIFELIDKRAGEELI